MGTAPLASTAEPSRPDAACLSAAGRRTRRRNMERRASRASRATADKWSRRQLNQPRTLHRTARQSPAHSPTSLGPLHPTLITTHERTHRRQQSGPPSGVPGQLTTRLPDAHSGRAATVGSVRVVRREADGEGADAMAPEPPSGSVEPAPAPSFGVGSSVDPGHPSHALECPTFRVRILRPSRAVLTMELRGSRTRTGPMLGAAATEQPKIHG